MFSNLNIHRIDDNNVGDMMCSPLNYFDVPNCSKKDIEDKELYDDLKDKNLIIGGGGLLFYVNVLNKLYAIANGKIITWGLGHNTHNITSIILCDLLSKSHLNGIRDYGLNVNWVPCVSCMNEEFDADSDPIYDIVVYEHKHEKIPIYGLPKNDNSGNNIKDKLDFLRSGNTILTNTYHGMYWGVLLKRNVLVINPFSSRFYGMKYPVILTNVNEWKNYLNKTQTYNSALDECRNVNKDFYRKVLNLL